MQISNFILSSVIWCHSHVPHPQASQFSPLTSSAEVLWNMRSPGSMKCMWPRYAIAKCKPKRRTPPGKKTERSFHKTTRDLAWSRRNRKLFQKAGTGGFSFSTAQFCFSPSPPPREAAPQLTRSCSCEAQCAWISRLCQCPAFEQKKAIINDI